MFVSCLPATSQKFNEDTYVQRFYVWLHWRSYHYTALKQLNIQYHTFITVHVR